MNYILFAFYLLLFSWILTRVKFIKNAELGFRNIILLFLLKVFVGIIYGMVTRSSAISDNWEMHAEGVNEFHLLFNDPKSYIMNVFHDDYKNDYAGLLDTTDSYWNVLRSRLMAKLLSIFDIFSGCSYYVNTIFYNFLVFFGFIAIYRIYKSIFPDKQTLLIIGVFLLPSLLYFSSGIHKDGLIFLGIATTCYNMLKLLRGNRKIVSRVALIILGLSTIFLLRNFVLITLLPALLALWLALRNREYVARTFAITYLLFTVLFFSLHYVGKTADLPRYVSERQIAFNRISRDAGSAINVNLLFPTFRSFFNNGPQALNHSLMRPYVSEKHTFSYVFLSVEILAYELLFLLFFFSLPKRGKQEPFVYFGIFFALSMMMIIGYTIPVVGAIVRYRSIYFPFLIVPLLCSLEWKKLNPFKKKFKESTQTNL